MLILTPTDSVGYLKSIFQEYHQSVKQFGSTSGPTFLDSNINESQSRPAGTYTHWIALLTEYLSSADLFLKIISGIHSVRNTFRVSNSLDTGQDRRFVGPDLGPNCLQRLSADERVLIASSDLSCLHSHRLTKNYYQYQAANRTAVWSTLFRISAKSFETARGSLIPAIHIKNGFSREMANAKNLMLS